MKPLPLVLLLTLIVLLACKKEDPVDPPKPDPYEARDSIKVTLDEHTISGTTIRAIEVINDSVVWFAGSNGKWGYTLDNGKNWVVEQMTLSNNTKPEFRSIAVTDNGNVFLVSVSQPAALFMSSDNGLNWNQVYEDTLPGAFFDAVEFFNSDKGILLGDPKDSCFHFATTDDGGQTWQKVSCADIPPALPDEYPFAASNTNIAISGSNAWIGTGGKSASRVYHSNNFGQTWAVYNTPITSGAVMTGIYAVDFYNDKKGIVAGGNWDYISDNNQNIAITTDGGVTWKLVSDGTNDGYTSCIQFIPGTEGKELFKLKGRAMAGTSSMAYSNNDGNTWQILPNSNYLCVRFASKDIAWLSGKNKIARLLIEDASQN